MRYISFSHEKKGKMRMKKIMRSIPGKIIIYLLTCVFMVAVILSIGVAFVCYENNMYDENLYDILDEDVNSRTYWYSKEILESVIAETFENDGNNSYVEYDYDTYYGDNVIPDNTMYSITDEDGRTIRESKNYDTKLAKYTYYLRKNTGHGEVATWDTELLSRIKDDPSGEYISIKVYYEGDGYPATKDFERFNYVVTTAYFHKYDVYKIGIAAVIFSLIFYVMMMCVSARRPGSDEVHPGYLNPVLFDLMLFLAGMVGAFMIYASANAGSKILEIILGCITIVYAVMAFNALSMSAAARAKEGTLISNTIIYKVCKLCWNLVKKYVFGFIRWVWKLPGKMLMGIGEIFRGVPLVWKSLLIFCVISFIDLVAIIIFGWDWEEWDVYAMFWVFEHIVLLVLVCRFMLGLRSLQAGGRALAEGNLNHKVDTSKLVLDFKEHGENLNHISEGMVSAVEEKMKSERMKTELITNVSHDIKTPLTSIINYADLIGKEQTENEKITEYTEVLLRQSERLKRLIEDLVEASKASTGNLEVELAPCEASMFITQIAGEYEEKLAKSNLSLITKGTDKSVKIMADGRRMLRVFDNLMNNICKYALENSRVYLSLEVSDIESGYHMTDVVGDGIKDALSHFSKKENEQNESDAGNKGKSRLAVITFKNTSRQELDMSPEELMERFVRGDQSRNTEGNGLGLSIARSLTELQGGTFDIAIDGDLFKVVLTFPVRE